MARPVRVYALVVFRMGTHRMRQIGWAHVDGIINIAETVFYDESSAIIQRAGYSALTEGNVQSTNFHGQLGK